VSAGAAPRDEQRDDALLEAVARRQARKERARREGRPGLAKALGTSGMIGWSVALPTLVGIAVGVWLDRRSPEGGPSWTLTLMAVGLLLGCANAWHWVRRESEGD